MRRKILFSGMILLFFSGCFPHLGQFTPHSTSEARSPESSACSLFTQEELDALFSREPGTVQSIPFIASAELSAGDLLTGRFPPSISDESNDDFDLEMIPQDTGKHGLDFDIPIVINARVEQFIQYFQTTRKNRFAQWLARSEKYVPLMRNLLKENGLPEDLVYLALIESGFNPYAYSRSKAMGPWQFIYPTGKRYGLRVDWWVDERRDPEKSTIAAAKYLKDLYDMFECWFLAAASYNAGEGKIATAMKRYRTEDFWELAKYRYLKQETKDYVPQMIAAALIAKDPEAYGFEGIEYQEPLCYDKVKVPEVTSLALVAKTCEVSVEALKDLNPELLRDCTPPGVPDYEIRIPCGTKEVFLANFEALRPTHRFQFKAHRVKKGETLSGIARSYRVKLEPMLEINHMKRSTLLHKGMNLLIPIPLPQAPKAPAMVQSTALESDPSSKPEEITYTIQRGDSLWSIANEMGVTIGSLSRWNNLHPDQKLIPGNKLRIRRYGSSASSSKNRVAGSEAREVVYKVREGDTLWGIAKKYNLSVSEILSWNALQEADRIRPEDQLRLKIDGIKSSALN
jgi:membrane-bound lytic murein transglycosylase D